jgi:general secretion pathway protein G
MNDARLRAGPIFVSRLRSRKAFTLLEIMAVVIIIGMLLTLLITRVGGNVEKARQDTAHAMIMGTLRNGLNLYEMDNGHYPSTELGLKALVEKPTGEPAAPNWRSYLEVKMAPKDPWGHDYIYTSPGRHNTDSYDLSSMGRDGVESEDDIRNW